MKVLYHEAQHMFLLDKPVEAHSSLQFLPDKKIRKRIEDTLLIIIPVTASILLIAGFTTDWVKNKPMPEETVATKLRIEKQQSPPDSRNSVVITPFTILFDDSLLTPWQGQSNLAPATTDNLQQPENFIGNTDTVLPAIATTITILAPDDEINSLNTISVINNTIPKNESPAKSIVNKLSTVESGIVSKEGKAKNQEPASVKSKMYFKEAANTANTNSIAIDKPLPVTKISRMDQAKIYFDEQKWYDACGLYRQELYNNNTAIRHEAVIQTAICYYHLGYTSTSIDLLRVLIEEGGPRKKEAKHLLHQYDK